MILRTIHLLQVTALLGAFTALPVLAQEVGMEGVDESPTFQEEDEKAKDQEKKADPWVEEDEEGTSEFQLHARDLRSFDEILLALLQPTELGATRLGRVRPYPVANLELVDLGNLRLYPYFDTQVIYDDNILLRDGDEQTTPDSVIWQTDLGGLGLYEFAEGNGRIDFGWVSSVSIFEENASSFSEHVGDLNFNYQGNEYTVLAGYKWEERVSPLRADITGNRERDITTLYAKGNVRPVENIIAEVGWSWQDTQFERWYDSILDMSTLDLYASGGYEFDEGKKFLLEYGYTTLDYFESALTPGSLNDGVGHRVLAGFELRKEEPGQKEWSLIATVGCQWVEYDDDHAVGDTNDSEAVLIANVTGETWIAEDTKFTASYRRMVTPSSFSNFLVVDRLDSFLEMALSSSLRVKGGTYLEYADPSISGPMGNALTRFGIGVGARYYFETFASLGVDYEYRQRIWSRPGLTSDYQNHRVALSLSFHF